MLNEITEQAFYDEIEKTAGRVKDWWQNRQARKELDRRMYAAYHPLIAGGLTDKTMHELKAETHRAIVSGSSQNEAVTKFLDKQQGLYSRENSWLAKNKGKAALGAAAVAALLMMKNKSDKNEDQYSTSMPVSYTSQAEMPTV